jgi:ATP-dependent DNA helicase DinG
MKRIRSPYIERETTRLIDVLDLAIDVLKVALGRSELLDAAFERANAIKARIERVCEVSITGYSY